MLTNESKQTRRGFVGKLSIGVGAAPALIGLSAKTDRVYSGGFVFESQERGHRLRDGVPFTPKRRERARLVIAGGGMSGLCAAWWLQKKGFHDFVVLEMEAEPGGNSRSGQNEVSAYPWGAHYIPVPNRESILVREMLEEFGALHNGEWQDRFLCHTPQERLFLHGRWQEGIEPELAVTAEDHREYIRFNARIREFRDTGAFTIPMALGERKNTPELAGLDTLTFAQWLTQEGFRSKALWWFCDYSTRDDYGANVQETSAWAGIHYFAARSPEEKGPLTWPEGNGWLLGKLFGKVGKHVRTGQAVSRVRREGTGWRVTTEETEWLCEAVIFAAPAFLAPYLIEGFASLSDLSYSPWMVTNLTLDRLPKGAEEPAWDNVIYGSPSLGYVVATHQSLRTYIDRTVWTHYWALAGGDPRLRRAELLKTNWKECSERVLQDLQRAHPDIRACVRHIDIYRNGHAMCRPTPGFLSQPERHRLHAGMPGLAFAHADGSGFSIFEEAQYRGVEAARRVLSRLGGRPL